jgi:hypothetical protein
MSTGLEVLMAMAQQGAKDEASRSALKKVKLGVEDNVVHIGLSVPVDEVQKAVQSAMNSQMKTMTASRRRPAPELPAIQQAPAPQQAAPPLAVTEAPPVPAPQPASHGETAAAATVSASKPAAPIVRNPRIPPNAEIMIQSSPKDMGTVVILGSKK